MKIGTYQLDQAQETIIKDETNYLLVTAGAGSGKTLTILGKVAYLIKEKNILPNEILCISFTKTAANNLKERLKQEVGQEIPTYTFHKLALEILKETHQKIEISDPNLLEYITTEFFKIDIYNFPFILKNVCIYFKKNTKEASKTYELIEKEEPQRIRQLEKLCITFIHLMKCNNYQTKDFVHFIKQIKRTINYPKYKKEKILLMLIINIYLKYQQYLYENKEIDFDDMIIKATTHLKQHPKSRKLKYIIIDEYQDTSYIRFLLIKELLKQSQAKLLVVGDDFQSIYKFTGCDVSLFTNFTHYFPNAKIMKLEKTYRNSQELIRVAGNFIMKNKNQIKKNLSSDKHLKRPIIIKFYYNIKETFYDVIKTIPKEKSILVLGRNNNDIKILLNKKISIKNNKLIIKNYEYLDITYMTAHKSKGLESDIVMIINLENKLMGFPSQIKEEQITRLVTKNKDIYPFSEERRLFYVALTRTKNEVYLFVPKKNPSIFIEELLQFHKFIQFH